MISSIKYKNYEDACYFLDLLIRKGGDLNIVVTIDGDFEFQNSLAYKLYLKSQYELSRKFWLSHHNFELRSNIVSLVKHDQREYCNTIGLLEEVSEKNTDEFINLLENSMLPSEDEIGGISINDSLPITLPIYTPLIIHAFQNGDESFYKPIMNSFRNGIISPEITAFLLQFSSSTNLPKCVLISCNGDLYEKLFDKKLESEYNTVRRNLSLCPHDFEIEKLIFNAKKSDFLIFAPNCKYGSENEFYKEGYVMIK